MGLDLTLFGPLQAALAGQTLTDFRSGRVQNLLIYLVLEATTANARPQSRTALATLLWPDEPERAAKQNLRQTLYQLRQLLGEPTPPFLLITNDTVQWNPAADYRLDVADFLAHLARGALAEAVQLYTGDLLTGLTSSSPLFEEWLLLMRERFHLQALEALDRLTQLALQQEVYSDAQGYARRQLALEPWRETAHQQLMRALALAGDRSAALAQYEQCRRLLAEELAVEPGAETVALYQAIRRGEIEGKTRRREDQKTEDRRIEALPAVGSEALLPRVQDWGEAPEPRLWYGRQEEMAQLTEWVAGDVNAPRARLVTVLGMGGMGKTTLAVHLAHHLADQFDVVIWRSLVNAPPLTEILRSWLHLLDEQPTSSAAESFDAQLNRLFTALRNRRCLLVLDNAESIMQGATQAGRYQPGYEAYGQLFKRMGESSHQSCLLITSREQPQEIARLERTLPAVRTLLLSGLPLAAGATMLTEQGLHSPPPLTQRLITHYSGNPLALLLVAETIQDLFDGDVAAFLQTKAPLFADIRDVLDQHFVRLSPLERDILLWLAIEREALTPTQINANFPQPAPTHLLLDAITSLRRRALLEKSTTASEAQGAAGGESGGFTLQNVVTEYATEFLINEICREIAEGQPALLKSHALLKAGAKEYVRQSQARLLVQPVIDQLTARLGRPGLITHLRALPVILRQTADRLVGYGGGNVLNLLRHLGADLSELDFSQLAVWQAYLPGAAMPGASFAGSDLRGCRFADTFGTVVSVAFHPNGKVLAAGTANDGKIRLWRLADAHCLAVLAGHTNIVWTLAFSPDGSFLVSGSEDHTIAIWQVDEAVEQVQRVAVLTSEPEAVWHLTVSADGRWLASGSGAGVVRLWDWRTQQLVATLRGHTTGVNVVAFSPNGQWLTSSGKDCTICLWDVEAAAAGAADPLAARLQAHEQRVWSLAFSPDNNQLVSGDWGGALCLWDLTPVTMGKAVVKRTAKAALSPPRQLQGHTAVITTLAFLSADQVVSTSEDHTIRLWDTIRGEERTNRALQGYNGNVWYTAISADGQWLAGGGGDQSVHLWNLRNGDLVRSLHGHAQGVMALAVTPDGSQLAAAYQDYTIRLWDMTTQTQQRVLVGHTSEIESLAFAPQPPDKKPLLASGGSVEQNIQLWDVASGQRLRTLAGQNGWVYRLAFHPGGDWLASVSGESLVRLWAITPTAVTLQETLRVKEALLRSVAFAADGNTLAAGSTTGAIYLWQQQRDGQWRFLTQLQGHSDMVTSLAFSPDGKGLASGSYDRTIGLWHWRTGALVQRCQGHSDWIWQVAFQPQVAGSAPLLASCSSDNTVRLWDVAQGQTVRILSGHTNWVRDVVFNLDGATLMSGSSDETIKWWDVANGACLATMHAPRPYEGVSIAGATSLTAAQRSSLKALGAVD